MRFLYELLLASAFYDENVYVQRANLNGNRIIILEFNNGDDHSEMFLIDCHLDSRFMLHANHGDLTAG